jgi:serine/threonine-protein kinase
VTLAVVPRTASTGLPDGYDEPVPITRTTRGSVWRARNRSLDVDVLVVVEPGVLDAEGRRRAAETARRLVELGPSPHLVATVDAGLTATGEAFAARELPDAPTLGQVGIGAADPLAALAGAARGLAVLHEAGLVHGAVSPDALIVSNGGRVAIAGALVGPHAGTAADDVAALAGLASTLLGRSAPPPILTRAVDVDPSARPSAAELAEGLEQIDTLPPSAGAGLTGTPLGSRYLLYELLGRGAMGEVRRGIRRDGTRPVAVKLLRPELADDHELVTRFLQERAALTAVEHPNVVRVHDLVAEGSTLAIVMEPVDGPNLRRYLRERGPLGPDAAADLLAQIAAGLAAVHAAGVVHRDLKPENVLLDRSGAGGEIRARLTDFGIARRQGGPRLTQMDRLLGTPEYVAPEMVAGETATAASDVYAFGVIAYEVLAGRRPFEADHPAALLQAHLTAEPAPPPDLDPRAWPLIAACLAKDPARRPGAAALADGFAALAAGVSPAPLAGRAEPGEDELETTGATAAPPARPAEARPHGRRRRPLLLVAAIGVVAVAGLAAGIWAAVGGPPDDDSSSPPSTTAVAAPAPEVRYANVQARPGASGQVVLTFDDFWSEPGFQQYRVLRDDDVPLPDRVPAGATTLTLDNLAPGTQHCFYVIGIFTPSASTTTSAPGQAVRPQVCQAAGE